MVAKSTEFHEKRMDDDSFDELSVPEDWLEQGSKRRASHTSDSESEPTPPKRAKLSNALFTTSQPSSSALDYSYNNLNKKDGKSSSKGETNLHLNYGLIGDRQGQGCSQSEKDVHQNSQSNTELSDPKLEEVSLNENEHQDVLYISSDSPNETFEDSSINEPDTCDEMKVDEVFENESASNVKFENNNDDVKQKNINITEAGKVIPIIPKNIIVKTNPDFHSTENNINNSSETLVGKDGSISVISETTATTILNDQQTKPEQLEKKIHLHKNASLIRDANIVAGIITNKDLNAIYDILLDNQDREDRLDFVTAQLLEERSANLSPNAKSGDILKDLHQVMSEVPSADANEVYVLLESLPPRNNRVKKVVKKLKKPVGVGEVNNNPEPPPPKKDSSFIDDQLLANDPLFKDMRTIAKMFPKRDRNEIYAFLEAHYNKTDRLQVVINELMNSEDDKERPTQELGLQIRHPRDVGESSSMKAEEDTFEQEVERMKLIFPDCDPNYLFEQLQARKHEPKRTEIVAAKLFEDRNYPKLKDRLEKEKEREKKLQAPKRDMTIPEFLQKFPDPKKMFMNLDRHPSELYKEHAEICLKNEFPMLKIGYIRNTVAKHLGHLYPAYQEISEFVVGTPIKARRHHNKFLKSGRHVKVPLPDKVDEYFYHELWFIHNEQSVIDYPKQKELERKLKIDEAKQRGEHYECCCCLDECLFEELASCPDGHLFCKTCVLRSTEAAFGEMKIKFPCLTGECDQNISLNTLQSIIPATLFSKIVYRIQEEEVQQANIPDLVTCPFCPFATIMPDPDDKVFKCLNPECLKDSCRLCQEPNHIPLRCNEVEKKAETDMRTYIENRISEAVMRKCHKCGKRFVKETGCNKMTCVCGANSCYACRAQDIDYNHFNNNKKCANTDPNVIHKRDMEEAADKAKAQYLLEHPEAKNIELKTDFKEMIKNVKTKKGRQNRHNLLFPMRFARYNYYGVEVEYNVNVGDDDDDDSDDTIDDDDIDDDGDDDDDDDTEDDWDDTGDYWDIDDDGAGDVEDILVEF